jgi:predicted small integral membrane protein
MTPIMWEDTRVKAEERRAVLSMGDYAVQRIRNRPAPHFRNNVRQWMRGVNWGCLCLMAYMTIIIVGGMFMIWRLWS